MDCWFWLAEIMDSGWPPFVLVDTSDTQVAEWLTSWFAADETSGLVAELSAGIATEVGIVISFGGPQMRSAELIVGQLFGTLRGSAGDS